MAGGKSRPAAFKPKAAARGCLMMEDESYEEMALDAGIGWCRLDDLCFVPRVSAASNDQQLPWLFLGEVVRTLRRCSICVDPVDV
jgi:hypothetical protein